MNLKIREYDESHKNEVCLLFNTIYRDDGEQANRLMTAYLRNTELHITTKIAFSDDGKIVGQVNMWRSRKMKDRATIGYHVHPDYRRKGIAIALCNAAMRDAEEAGLKNIYILTYQNNEPSIAVARSLGFEPASMDFPDKNIIGFIKCLC